MNEAGNDNAASVASTKSNRELSAPYWSAPAKAATRVGEKLLSSGVPGTAPTLSDRRAAVSFFLPLAFDKQRVWAIIVGHVAIAEAIQNRARPPASWQPA